jgi:hypothetical protein
MIPAMGVIGHFLWELPISLPITMTDWFRPVHRHIKQVTGGRLQVTGIRRSTLSLSPAT